jgi:hypothetical protein
MKLLFPFFFSLALSIHCQTIKDCRLRFDKYLNFHGSLNGLVRFENESICIYNAKGIKEVAVYASELPMLTDFFDNTTFQQQEQFLSRKGVNLLTRRQRDSLWIFVDDRRKLPKKREGSALSGFRIAIDPGHFAANLEDAAIEQKFLHFVKDSTHYPADTVKIFESELTHATALFLRSMLEEQGATVFLTRENNNFTSFNCSYRDWLIHQKSVVLDSLMKSERISPERYHHLIALDDHKFFREFFRDYDIMNRAKIINQFNPHVTAIIHYNVDEKNEPWKKTTDKNFTMAFIGGAFTAANFEKHETKVHFLRLLLSRNIEESERLASLTVQNFKEHLKLKIATSQDADYLKNNCIATGSAGVFSRNLILCRQINSPLVYGEALYQDNEKECIDLMNRSIEKCGIQSSPRILAAASSYYLAISDFLKKY